MLPSLSGLRVSGVCRPCAPPTGAVLPTWSDRGLQLSAEELARIPDSYQTKVAVAYSSDALYVAAVLGGDGALWRF